jgi:type IV pilus assembly protein PilF
LRTASLFAVLSVVAACVSTTNVDDPKVDKKKALEAHVKLGMNYLQKGERDRAFRSFAKAEEIDPRSAEAIQGQAMVHQLNGERDVAEEKFKRSLKLRSDFSKASIQLSYARFLYENERCDEAGPLLTQVTKDFNYSGRVNALYLLGRCALLDKDIPRAKGAFEHALNLDTRAAPAALELAEILFGERDYENSKRNLDIYAANARQSARSLWLGIRIERIFGNKDKEASYALALKNLHPYSKEYLEYKRLFESSR